MDEDDCSWVRRTKFSHSVVRSSSGREQFGAFVEQFNRGVALKQKGSNSEFKLHGLNPASFSIPKATTDSSSKAKSPIPGSELKLKDLFSDGNLRQPVKFSDCSSQEASMKRKDNLGRKPDKLSLDVPPLPVVPRPNKESSELPEFSFYPDEHSLNLQRVCSSPVPFYPKRTILVGDSATRSASAKVIGEGPKPKQRAKSPLPTRVISDVFKEAKSARQRFSTPPPRRKSSNKATSPTKQNASPPWAFPSTKSPGKLKNRKDTSWPRCFDNGGARVAALEVLEKWTVDRSKLLIGHRFASGAHSRLFHGIYKEQPVAVKFIRQPDDDENTELAAQLEKQFTTEVTILSDLYHRNVIKLVGACRSPPVFCVITEFLSGGSLRVFLHKLEHKSLPLEKIISIGLDIAHGMAYIHSQGVIHRDVKPENIIFDGDFCAKIVDFGIACEEVYCDTLADDPGTYRWMAPEMIKHKPYGRKIDVYSFGLLLWEMVTGSIPYEEMTPIQAAFAVVDKNLRPVVPASCPAPLRVLIEQCWALQPDRRPEFWQIVQILEKFKIVLERDGTLDSIPSSNCQEAHDHKNWLAHWIQKLKHGHPDVSGPPPPKML